MKFKRTAHGIHFLGALTTLALAESLAAKLTSWECEARADTPLAGRKRDLLKRQIPGNLDLGTRRETTSWVATYRPLTKSERVPLGQLHDWTLEIRSKAGEPFTGTVSLIGDMPLHLHGLASEPQVDRTGPGRFLVRGLRFHMPGWWTLGLKLTAKPVPHPSVNAAADVDERITFNLVLP